MPVVASYPEGTTFPPGTPTATVQANGRVKLDWAGVADADTYTVERSDNGGVTWYVVASVTAGG